MTSILMVAMFIIVGCNKNPVSANSGTLKYTLSTAKKTYTADDTLHFTLSVRNIGFTTDTVITGDAIQASWSLKNASGNVMYSGHDPVGFMMMQILVAPGESKVIDRWTHSVTNSTGSPLRTGSYTFAVDFSGHPASIGLNVK